MQLEALNVVGVVLLCAFERRGMGRDGEGWVRTRVGASFGKKLVQGFGGRDD
jgi:hypothetical protein